MNIQKIYIYIHTYDLYDTYICPIFHLITSLVFSKTFFVSISSEVDPEPLHTVVEGSEREMPLRRLGEMSSWKDLPTKFTEMMG